MPIRPVTATVLGLILLATAILGGAARQEQAVAGGTPVYVTTTADTYDLVDPACSLREAIFVANLDHDYEFNDCVDPDGSYDEIGFALGFGNPLIQIGPDPLPSITDPVVIVGGSGNDRVVLDGPCPLDCPSGANGSGLWVESTAPGTQISHLVINHFPDSGIVIRAANVKVLGNFIGTDPSGMVGHGNGSQAFSYTDPASPASPASQSEARSA